MPGYRFEVFEVPEHGRRRIDEWTGDYDDDEAAWQVASKVMLSGRQQVLVFRDGEERAFGSKASDELADAMDSAAWR